MINFYVMRNERKKMMKNKKVEVSVVGNCYKGTIVTLKRMLEKFMYVGVLGRRDACQLYHKFRNSQRGFMSLRVLFNLFRRPSQFFIIFIIVVIPRRIRFYFSGTLKIPVLKKKKNRKKILKITMRKEFI